MSQSPKEDYIAQLEADTRRFIEGHHYAKHVAECLKQGDDLVMARLKYVPMTEEEYKAENIMGMRRYLLSALQHPPLLIDDKDDENDTL
jgi:hypothetical protein